MHRNPPWLTLCLPLAAGFLFTTALPVAGEAPQAPDLADTASQFSVRTAADLINYGADLDAAVEIAPNVYQARGTGNTQMVTTPEGNVIIDTGTSRHAERHRELLSAVSDGPIRYVVVSHAHNDHAGGVPTWTDEGTQVVAHARYPEAQRYLNELMPYQTNRNLILFFGRNPVPQGSVAERAAQAQTRVEPDILVNDLFEFELGGTRFEVIATPGAEGDDAVSVWLPASRILFTGDTLGPIFPMWPNLYTLRGEKMRFAAEYIQTLDRLIALEPEILVPSHFEPIDGAAEVRAGLQRIRDAVAYVHDAVVDGMNSGRTVHELMRDIQLPPELELTEAHGKVSWVVRSIWEGYAGWFYLASTTELYPAPVSDMYGELAELSGGPDVLARRAAEHVQAGRPVQALHLVEIALAADANHRAALEARLAALELLLESAAGVNFYEVRWLTHRIALTREQLE